MKVLTIADAQARLPVVLDEVVAERNPVAIERHGAEAVVVVPMSEWNAIAETIHLLATPANAEHLRASIRELNGG